MIRKIPTSTCIAGDVIFENIYDINQKILVKKDTIIDDSIKRMILDSGITTLGIYNPFLKLPDCDKLHKEIIYEVRNSLSGVLFRKEYIYTGITEYLARMYESINDNPITVKFLDRIKKIDEYTFIHSINTAFYSMFIAIWMELSDQDIINATQAGILHDIGKIYIPQETLNKRGELNAKEYEIIKKHTVYGYFLLNEFEEFNQEIKRAVLFHHERADSSGYPLNASSDYVGVISKIVAIADIYDAMTTDRIYKEALDPFKAIAFLRDEGMKILDKEILEVFLKNIPIYDFKMNE